jgi:hypothetical protein
MKIENNINMNLQEQISRIHKMMGVINESKYFHRRVQPSEIRGEFNLFDDQVFYETNNYKQFKYELVLKSLEHIMWIEYNLSWDELPEQEEIDYVNKVADMYDHILRDLYDKNLNRRDK